MNDKEPVSGGHYIVELERGLIHIEQHPALYPVAYRDVHKAFLRTIPYTIYYLVGDTQLIVLRVLHQRRREPAW